MDVGKIEQLTETTPLERLIARAASLPPLDYPDGWIHPIPATEIVAIDWERKLDALLAAVIVEDAAIRDRILARAKALEAEAQEDDE